MSSVLELKRAPATRMDRSQSHEPSLLLDSHSSSQEGWTWWSREAGRSGVRSRKPLRLRRSCSELQSMSLTWFLFHRSWQRTRKSTWWRSQGTTSSSSSTRCSSSLPRRQSSDPLYFSPIAFWTTRLTCQKSPPRSQERSPFQRRRRPSGRSSLVRRESKRRREAEWSLMSKPRNGSPFGVMAYALPLVTQRTVESQERNGRRCLGHGRLRMSMFVCLFVCL